MSEDLEFVIKDEEDHDIETSRTAEEVIPSMSSPEWHDYIMDKLLPEEKYNDRPTVEGLRRVAQEVFGGPINTISQEVIVAQFEYAVVQVCLELPNKIRVYGVGEVNNQNAEQPFIFYAAPLAETRAEGRALRKALCLRKITTADEVSDLHVQSTENPGMITGSQQMLVRKFTSNLGISIPKMLQYIATSMGHQTYESLEVVPYNIAIHMIQRLNQYNLPASNPEHKEIPADILENNNE